MPYWPYDLAARVHDAPCYCNRRKQWAKPSHLSELDVIFSVLVLLDASIGMIGLWFQHHSQTPMTHQELWYFWANLDCRSTSSTLFEQCPCKVVFAQSFAILSQSWLMPKISVKIACHEPKNIPISSVTSLIVIRRLSKIIFFTAFMFSSIIDVLGRPGQVSSLTSSRPSLNRLYHNWTCVLLIVLVPNILSRIFLCNTVKAIREMGRVLYALTY